MHTLDNWAQYTSAGNSSQWIIPRIPHQTQHRTNKTLRGCCPWCRTNRVIIWYGVPLMSLYLPIHGLSNGIDENGRSHLTRLPTTDGPKKRGTKPKPRSMRKPMLASGWPSLVSNSFMAILSFEMTRSKWRSLRRIDLLLLEKFITSNFYEKHDTRDGQKYLSSQKSTSTHGYRTFLCHYRKDGIFLTDQRTTTGIWRGYSEQISTVIHGYYEGHISSSNCWYD